MAFCELRLFLDDQVAAQGEAKEWMCAEQFSKLVERLDKQKGQRSEWAYAAIVAIAAVSVVKRTFRIPWLMPAYLLLGTAGGFMLESIRASDEYERSVAQLITLTKVSDVQFAAVNSLLWRQLTWLNTGVLMLLLFVSCFLVAVLSGKVVDEVRKDA
jgi:hypothetical protein